MILRRFFCAAAPPSLPFDLERSSAIALNTERNAPSFFGSTGWSGGVSHAPMGSLFGMGTVPMGPAAGLSNYATQSWQPPPGSRRVQVAEEEHDGSENFPKAKASEENRTLHPPGFGHALQNNESYDPVFPNGVGGFLIGRQPSSGVIVPGGASTIVKESPTAYARRIGREGEEAAEMSGSKVGIKVPGSNRSRVPDSTDRQEKKLFEVKNVGYQALTAQLVDYMTYCRHTGYTLYLYVSKSTIFSALLEAAIAREEIVVRYLKGID